ncbi:MAG: 2-amino-4-hydroxy-6-hydroxymethyldihydropteridine diphosphokinase [Hyphomicrobiaceae bacterium]
MTGLRAYLSLGGNIGEPEQAMGAALRALDAEPAIEVTAVSSLYRTPPWGKTDQPDFLNCAAELTTTLSPRALIDTCLAAERALKRERLERWGPRVIDIDILTFGDVEIDEPGLQIPHPRMLERAFVLVPLAEIAPGMRLDGRSVEERASAFAQTGIEKLGAGRNWWRR